MKYWIAIACVGLIFPGISTAQEYTDIELMEAFDLQRKSVQDLNRGVATRGLTRQLEPITADNVDEPITDITDAPKALSADSTTETVSVGAAPSTTDTQPASDGPIALVETEDGTAIPKVIEHLVFDSPVNIRVAFGYDSAVLTEDQQPKLIQMCRVIKGGDIKLFRIVGHTDASGPDNYNERLSLFRAKEVKRFLIETCGLPSERFEAIGLGERFLYDKDDPRNGLNRRVEFQALS